MELLHNRVVENMIARDVRASSSPDEYFVFCVGTDPVKQGEFKRWAYAEDIGIKPLIGSYRGQLEHSFIANMNDFDRIKPWLNLQESVLLLGSANHWNVREASMKYLATDSTELIGRLKSVTPLEAVRNDSWTYDPYTNQFFIVV